jgi:hypothetical protein
MEDQPPLPPNQLSGNPVNDPLGSQTIEQGLASTPYPQNIPPVAPVPPPNNSVQPVPTAPQAPVPVNTPIEPPLPAKAQSVNRRLAIVVAVLVLLLLAIAGVVIFGRHSGHPAIVPNNSIHTSNTPPARAATSDTPLRQTAYGSSDTAGLAISIAQVIPDPPVIGDPPNAGTHYVEIDLAVANNAKHATIVPGTFYYQTTAGNLLNTADTTGKKPDDPNKSVQVTDKEPLTALSLKPGKTDSSHYLLYQVPAADKGKLVWFQGYYDPGSTKLAIFDLY